MLLEPPTEPITATVVIPAHNEAAHLRMLLPTIARVDGLKVVLIDDGSTDDTKFLCEQYQVFCLQNSPAGGRDKALKIGLELARQRFRSTWYVMFDADNQHDPEFLINLLRLTPNANLVKGCRFFPGVANNQAPIDRILLARLLKLVVRCATSTDVHDMNCGLIAMSEPQLDWALSACSFTRHSGSELILRFLLSDETGGTIRELPIPAKYVILTERDYEKYFMTSPQERFFSRAKSVIHAMMQIAHFRAAVENNEYLREIVSAICAERHDVIRLHLSSIAYDL